MISSSRVSAAYVEIGQKTLAAIQRETADTWGARALAAYLFFKQTRQEPWKSIAEEYAHEAVEHAALAGLVYGPEQLIDLLAQLAQARRDAGAGS
jgi:hypothetical protein